MSNDSQANRTAPGWTSTQAYVMAVVCLLIGVAGGYLLRGSAGNQTAPTNQGAPSSPAMDGASAQITPEQLRHMAEKQAEPLMQQLKSTPNDPTLLANVGNVYYDAQQYKDAISYYDRALQIRPTDTNVRTDMGTAYWYLGDSDKAISEFETVLKVEPTKANTLLNLGVVQWQGKMDSNAAAATWEKLLATNPSVENKEKVMELLAQVKKHSGMKPGAKTDKPALN